MLAPRQPLTSGEIIITIIATFIQNLLSVRHCTQSLRHSVDFDPHNKPLRLGSYYFHFTGEEIEVQRSEVTFPGSHSVWQSQGLSLSFWRPSTLH